MPSVDSRESTSLEFQSYFVQCGGLKLFLSIITDKNFMVPGDPILKRSVEFMLLGENGIVTGIEDCNASLYLGQ